MKKKSKRFACGAEGHFARDCTANPTVNNVTMIKETTNPYLKRGKINGVEMTVLLDIGSYYTLLKSSVASQCKLGLRGHRATKPQVMRWYDILQEYDYDIHHRPGTKMQHVDALSRDPVPDQGGDTLDEVLAGRLDVCISLEKEDKVRMVQHVDEELRQICNILQKPVEQRTKPEKGLVYEYSMEGGLLYRWYQGRLLFVMPRSMGKSIVVAAHDQGGHLSVDKTISRIVQDYWFIGLRRYVKLHIRMCMECLMTKRPRERQPGLLHPISPGRRPFEAIHVDHVGPFITSAEGNRYILVLVDNLTKYVCLFPATDTSTEGALYAMDDFITKFGLPRKLITDRGTCFTSHKFENYCKSHGVTHILNSTRRPQANG